MTTNCRHCDKPLSLLQRLAKQEFCSAQHRKAFDRDRDDLALQRLMESRPGPSAVKETAEPPPAEPEFDRQETAAVEPEPPPPPPEPEPPRKPREEKPRGGGRRIITLGPITPDPVVQPPPAAVAEEAPAAMAETVPEPAVPDPPMRDLQSLIDALEFKPTSGLERFPDVLPFPAQPLPPSAVPCLHPGAGLRIAGAEAERPGQEAEAPSSPPPAAAAILGLEARGRHAAPRMEASGSSFTFARRTIVPPPRPVALAERILRAADLAASAPPAPESADSASVDTAAPREFPHTIATGCAPSVTAELPPTSRLDAWSRARQVAAAGSIAADPGTAEHRQEAGALKGPRRPADLALAERRPAFPPAPPVFRSAPVAGETAPLAPAQEPRLPILAATGIEIAERRTMVPLAPSLVQSVAIAGEPVARVPNDEPRLALRPAIAPEQPAELLSPCALPARMDLAPLFLAGVPHLAEARPACLLSVPGTWITDGAPEEEMPTAPAPPAIMQKGIPPLRRRFHVRLRTQDFPALPVLTPVACAFSRAPQSLVHR